MCVQSADLCLRLCFVLARIFGLFRCGCRGFFNRSLFGSRLLHGRFRSLFAGDDEVGVSDLVLVHRSLSSGLGLQGGDGGFQILNGVLGFSDAVTDGLVGLGIRGVAGHEVVVVEAAQFGLGLLDLVLLRVDGDVCLGNAGQNRSFLLGSAGGVGSLSLMPEKSKSNPILIFMIVTAPFPVAASV